MLNIDVSLIFVLFIHAYAFLYYNIHFSGPTFFHTFISLWYKKFCWFAFY